MSVIGTLADYGELRTSWEVRDWLIVFFRSQWGMVPRTEVTVTPLVDLIQNSAGYCVQVICGPIIIRETLESTFPTEKLPELANHLCGKIAHLLHTLLLDQIGGLNADEITQAHERIALIKRGRLVRG